MPLVPPKTEKLEAIARRFPVIDAQSLEACIWLLRTASALAESGDAHYARHGLSRGRFHVLINLYQSPAEGLSPAELAELSGVTRAAMTGLVDALVEGRMVARVWDAVDRRTYRVRLTERAFAWLHEFLPVHFRRMARLVSDLSPEEKRALTRLLGKVAGQIDGYQQPDPVSAPPLATAPATNARAARRPANPRRRRGVQEQFPRR